jgi:hypothetical protein
MIEKEECGIFFCYDALLALIPLMIILAAVAHIQIDPSISNQELVMYHQAQDTLNLMSIQNNPYEPSILEQLSSSISNKNLESTNKIVNCWLKNKLENRKYRLVEVNHLNGQEICSFGDMNNTQIVAVAVKSYDSYIYKLYIGI